MSETFDRKLKLREAAERIGLAPRTLRDKAKAGLIGYYQPTPNGEYMFRESQIREFEDRHTTAPKLAAA